MILIASRTPDGGIFQYRLSPGGRLTALSRIPCPDPNYMAWEKGVLYVLLKSPFPGSAESGLITVRDGAVSAPVPTGGKNACHLCVSEGEVYCVHYDSGDISHVGVRTVKTEGQGPDPGRQGETHPHCVVFAPDKTGVVCTDLGWDTVSLYDRGLNLVYEAKVPAGHGPRHLIFSEDGRFLYCANELASTLSVFAFREHTLTLLVTLSTLPKGFAGESYASAIRIRDGALYVSNRGHDSVVQFSGEGGDVRILRFFPSGGHWPRDFIKSGEYFICADERSDRVAVIRADSGTADEIRVPAPLAVLEIPE